MADRHGLRSRLRSEEILVLPGAADALTARLAEQAGYEAVYLTGAGFANAAFALPDIGLISVTEVVENLGRMTDAVDIPVVVDADTGYGELLSVRRTVRDLERAGAAAIQLEDQVSPKRCGHFDGQEVIGAEDMVAKISIALDSRRSEDLVLIARTDARGVLGFSAAVDRANLYAEAGADLIFVEAPASLEELTSLPSLVSAPLVANMVEGGKTPVLSVPELASAGFRVALFANTALRASMVAVSRVLQALRVDGTTSGVEADILPWSDRQRIVGLDNYRAIEERYASGNQASGPDNPRPRRIG